MLQVRLPLCSCQGLSDALIMQRLSPDALDPNVVIDAALDGKLPQSHLDTGASIEYGSKWADRRILDQI